MAETIAAPTFIKHEPDDHNNFMMSQSYTMSNPQFGNHFGNSNGDGVDPSELTMQNSNFMPYSFGSQQNLNSGFNLGNSGIDTDELLDLEINGQNGMQNNGMNFLHDQHQQPGLSMSHPGQMSQMYSNTPDGAPIQSPFIHGNFNYDQFRSMNQSQSMHNVGAFEQNYMNSKTRPNLQAVDRASSDARSPMTPKTPALGALNLGTPESGSFPSQPIRTGLQHRHQKTLSNQWDGTPGSAHSFVESPISSPGHPSHHAGISEILKSGKHASLPAKVDNMTTAQALESQEAKRRRRRASHNMVERRRRDNINERIQDLSHLVPQHRLEDDKVRKQLVNNSALSPSMGATAMSPPTATSLLAGGSGRRATAGNITMGLPIEEKEKGPNKGDILNGAVGWTRDLMWALHVKLQQESELAEYITSLGGTWPFEQTEEEKRMRTELLDAMEKNDPSTFHYSRAPGSGLRVPKHTNLAGEATQNNGTISPQSLSPAFNSGGSGSNSGGQGQPQFWSSSGHAGMSFKEEDEYSMEMN
ncbi:putative HLH transcription factor [Paecilomyces variotii]|uniref:Putative HLH transcription factor n=1 Tax=Byssochlamys spectabilis TaxID=264951 RepID=A0A443HPQ5_BYSSP|nr:putative HLH transcription factor [Paecilomyces variotii]KAJ9226902.1 transcriptional regulator family: Helix-loop-helix [Paecilomyces variotii]KAJ9246938.1 transcriptional regulator family: Helix-loop-helix [Paecilomyces variotii]KAJ9252069.1 transcriptional regulator family: Helix-loop-helix [Paecilomyces variotii]KAJ9286124.1 transcriptional regulator family: Helix-loop-helix [Paecilomyces variotii]KAJ9308266.1 transcriptional regulator family: Helix-loop-helix [Paecilomyces variotii]